MAVVTKTAMILSPSEQLGANFIHKAYPDVQATYSHN